MSSEDLDGLDVPSLDSFLSTSMSWFVSTFSNTLETIKQGKMGSEIPPLHHTPKETARRGMDKTRPIRTKSTYSYIIPFPILTKPQSIQEEIENNRWMYSPTSVQSHPCTRRNPQPPPRDVLNPTERAHTGQFERTLFIRTWYGNPSDPASQEKADADYERLAEVVSADFGGFGLLLNAFFVFDAEREFSSVLLSAQSESGDADAEFSDGVAIPRPGVMPSYVLAALTHCPDQIDGCRIEHLPDLPPVEDLDRQQTLLVLVGDRRACEEGWVPHLAINRKGQVLPSRVRDRADWGSINLGN
ncbi:hypothetical protein BJX68DRAFT_266650 [Aspergillus pseudodeflectus]|uniref:Uncharacterized protein n=1 Tax=Aspergillus pseudodeflectus TaxID=176178 RepID=A0ABR4KDS6_9EURO